MKRHKFNLSHWKLHSFHFGTLLPATWFEVLPGDTIQYACNLVLRAAPMVTPVMHIMEVRLHCFFVPNRIVWNTGGAANNGWEDFITGGQTGNDSQTHPFIPSNTLTGASGNNAGVSTLGDFIGCPTSGAAAAINLNALPFRAYQLIFNEWYRDQDLQNPTGIGFGGGSDGTTGTALQNVAWEKDYLTTARTVIAKPGAQTASVVFSETGTTPQVVALNRSSGTTNTAINVTPAGTAADAIVGTVDINNIRQQFGLQRYAENRARFGSRYTELLAYYGVRSSDARLQRPEYLGGGRSSIQVSEVLQTGVTTSGTASGVGLMYGHGITTLRAYKWRKFFEEHGIVMCMLSVRPRTMYSQRTSRSLLRSTSVTGLYGNKYDYWHPELEGIGQQNVNGLEADASAGNSSFGYQDRYDEYRRMESSVHGQFRSTLDTWHLSREFGSAPSLNSTFISCVPASRIFADTSNDNMYCLSSHRIIARRKLRKIGTPGGRF